jgi:multidrug transporter EmrE-like cation transporter
MAKLLIILVVGLICEAIGVVFLSRGLKEISNWLFSPEEIRDPESISARVAQHRDPVSDFIWQKLSQSEQAALTDPKAAVENRKKLFAETFNHLMAQGSIFQPQRFASVRLSRETRKLLARPPEGNQVVHLNRLLLEDAYPGALATPDSKPTSRSEILRLVGRGVTNPHILLGVFFEALFFIGLLMLMSKADVSFVWPLTSLSFVVTTIAAKIYLHEEVSVIRWSGVCLIMMGAGLITWTEKQQAPEPPPPVLAPQNPR